MISYLALKLTKLLYKVESKDFTVMLLRASVKKTLASLLRITTQGFGIRDIRRLQGTGLDAASSVTFRYKLLRLCLDGVNVKRKIFMVY